MTKNTIAQLAFEAGRAYENRLMTFGLLDCISGDDLAYAKGFGGQIKLKGDLSNFTELFATRGLTDRKIKALFEPIELLNEILNI
jgi:hypothetical protein